MKPELLAPAGNMAALRAAVQSGADAVYIGGEKFGARAGAENFSAAEMKKGVDYCHLYGVDVHTAVNTLIKEREIPELVRYTLELNKIGVDALIIHDIGAAKIIKSILPDMKLHASTQMTVTSIEGVRYLEKLGFDRVVLARELSEREIEYICKSSKAEIEVFVHGAICMCYSGQCLMSSILGGRSGNRGRCAQPCRLPYCLTENGKAVSEGYLLSPKDMALVNELNTLSRLGVSSLKIEGRLKSPGYVSAVTGVYRRCLDRGAGADKSDMRELTDAFSREGFTDGYFKDRLGADMMSTSASGGSGGKFTDEAKRRTLDGANVRKISVGIMATLKRSAPLEAAMYDSKGNYACVSGTLKPEPAKNRATDGEILARQLSKLGATPFVCGNISVVADEGITVPVSEINAVRRAAAEKLAELRRSRIPGKEADYAPERYDKKEKGEIILTAEASDYDQLKAAVGHGIKIIYVPDKVLGTLNSDIGTLKSIKEKNIEIVLKLPEILSDGEVTADSALISSPAAIEKYGDIKMYGDFRLNVFNSHTACHYSSLASVTLSPELNLREIAELCENTGARTEVIGYGRLPLMLMKNCPVRAAGKCRNGGSVYTLRDRKHQEFPIVCAHNCAAALLNSKPVFMADKIDDLKKLKINSIRLIFTVEKFSQCDKIIYMYEKALRSEEGEFSLPENTFTRGHFYRGVQ